MYCPLCAVYRIEKPAPPDILPDFGQEFYPAHGPLYSGGFNNPDWQPEYAAHKRPDGTPCIPQYVPVGERLTDPEFYTSVGMRLIPYIRVQGPDSEKVYVRQVKSREEY